MKRLQGISGLSFVALLLVGCGGNQDLDKAPAPKPSINKVSQPPIPTKPIPAASVTKGLTLSTEPTKIPIAKGRIDPFGAIAVAPLKITQPQTQQAKLQQPKTKPQAQATKTQQPKPQLQAQPTKPQQQAQPTKPQSKKIISDASKPSSSPIKPIPSQNLSVPLPPAPPSVEIAQAVQVKGVVELGGKVSAIVKESEQSDSRSVSAGDYVAQGKVLVKRIEFNGNREPVVILEQNGVEVLKQV
jgi:Tfp pilus assembly protein PilP